ncbi:MAG: hypothetical protein ACOYOI_00090 [Chthoniobacterales bacterium]
MPHGFHFRISARYPRAGSECCYVVVGVHAGAISSAAAPFGGIKESAYCREGSLHGISDYLSLKYICLGGR